MIIRYLCAVHGERRKVISEGPLSQTFIEAHRRYELRRKPEHDVVMTRSSHDQYEPNLYLLPLIVKYHTHS